MRAPVVLASALGLILGAGCAKEDKDESGPTEEAASGETGGEETEASDSAGEGEGGKAADPEELAEQIGVEPGGWEHAEDEGASAVVSASDGKVEVRRVGEESFAELEDDAGELYEGDQVRTGPESEATVTFADESVVELAELTAVAIGDRDAVADPAASAAVLYGVARFTVSPRARGEGPFLAYAPGGIIGTKGTVYAVGVAASGDMRVGVEEGEIEVAGTAKLDAPVALGAGKAVAVARGGEVAEPEPLEDPDWGAWRDEAEAEVDARATAEYHAERLAELEDELEEGYAELEELTAGAARARAKAEVQAEAGDAEAYAEIAPEIGGSVEGAYRASVRLQHLTYAMVGHAYLAGELYVRHPNEVKVVYEPAEPRVHGAILYHKKYHAVVHQHVRPLRDAYYDHHPVGRRRARVVDHRVPKFYARVKVKKPKVRARVDAPVYRLPEVKRRSAKKRLRVRGPAAAWYEEVEVKPAKGKRWYVRPKSPRAKVVLGAEVKAELRPLFRAPRTRPKAKAQVRFGGGVKVRDHREGKGKSAGAGGVEVRDHRKGKKKRVGVGAGKVEVESRDHRKKKKGVGAGGVSAGGKVEVGGGGVKVKSRDHRKKKKKSRDHRNKKRRQRDHRKKKKEGGAKMELKGKLEGGVKVGD